MNFKEGSSKPLPTTWTKLPPDVRLPEELIAFEESDEKTASGTLEKDGSGCVLPRETD